MVYWVLTCSLLDLDGHMLETKDMGLIFHENSLKMKKSIKEETGLNCQKLRNIVIFSKREVIKPNKLMS